MNEDEKSATDYGIRRPRSGRGGRSQSYCRASQVVSKRNPYKLENKMEIERKPCQRIATWNIQSMYESGKSHNIVQEMKRLNIDVLGLSETRWPSSGECRILDYTVYYSGNDSPQHRNGVGIITAPHVQAKVKSFIPFSDRMMLLRLHAFPIDLNIIQLYAPTADKDETTIEEFYEQLEQLVKLINKHEIKIIMGDFNAKVGKGKVENTVGGFGLGERNDRGDRLISFCQEHNMILSNTLFKLPARRLYTWKSPADTPENNVRNQIDYIAVPMRYRNAIKSAKTYPGADVPTDHNPVVCELEVRLKRIKKNPTNERIDIRKLSNSNTRQQIQESISSELNRINEHTIEVTKKWNEIEQAIQKTCPALLKQDRVGKKEWMTEEILDMMEERRKYKNRDITKYREIHGKIKTKIRDAKEKWLSDKCTEIEQYEKRYDYHNMHKKIKEMTNKRKYNNLTTGIYDYNGNLISEPTEILKVWKKYVEVLFDSDRPNDPPIQPTEMTGPSILKSEVEKAIMSLKNNKAPGPDNIHGEILKILYEKDNQFQNTLTTLLNSIYDSGEIPENWLQSTFVAIPKKPNSKHCDQHRLISLINQITKVFTKIIYNRIYNKCEAELGKSQFGFRNSLGTREALFCFQVLIQRCRDVNKDVYISFVDYTKAFDNVRHDQLIKTLQNVGIDYKDIRIVANLYWNQSARIKIGKSCTENIEIRKGVRQGCILSPLLFNIYSEQIFKKALEEEDGGIKMNGEVINNIRYADDTVVLANSLDELRYLMERVQRISEENGLSLNIDKTKWMLVSKTQQPPRQLTLNNQLIHQVDSYVYLGTLASSKWEQATEIRSRIEKARATFNSMKNLFTNSSISLPLKIRLIKCYVFPVLLYGAEAWTLTEALMKRLEAFEMWVYRRILRISYTEHITNIEVLRRMGKEKEISLTVKKRKLEYLGHLMRHDKYRLLQLIVQGKIDSKRGPGRRRHSWLHNLRQWFGMTSIQLFRNVAYKIRIAMMIANVRNGQGT